MSHVETFRLTYSLDCPHCRQPGPVNGLTDAPTCPHCLRDIVHGPGAWLQAFDLERLAEVLDLPSDRVSQTRVMGRVDSVSTLGRAPLPCPACEAPLALSDLSGSLGPGSVRCGACGEQVPVREADDLARLVFPGATHLVGESLRGPDDGTGGAAEPVLFACMGCGGSLTVDGSSRTVTCTYCEASNFLPDALWSRLHPVPAAKPFAVQVSWSDAFWRRRPADRDSEVQAGWLGTHPLPPALLQRLATAEDETLRARIASVPGLPPAFLRGEAENSDWSVRQRAAANPDLPRDLLERLAEDEDSDVRTAVASRPDLPPHLVDRLLEGDDEDIRALLLQREDVAPSRLAQAMLEGDRAERLVAAGRAETPDAALVERARVETAPAVLKALGRRVHQVDGLLDALKENPDRDARAVARKCDPTWDPETAQAAKKGSPVPMLALIVMAIVSALVWFLLIGA